MAIITITTDFGEKDHFVGAVKGAIYSELSEAVIVDISHNISPFNITEASYVISCAYKSFPKGSIHIIGIDSELTPENSHIAIKLDGHYFICADNGILGFLTSEITPQNMVEINIQDRFYSNFSVLDVFVKVAAHIARGGTLEVIGKTIERIKVLKEMKPLISANTNQIIGNVVYIDNYGNVVTNITQSIFNQVGKGRKYEIIARNHRFETIYKKYSEFINFGLEKKLRQAEGKKLALFNVAGFLELAIYKSNLSTVGGASTLLGFSFRDTVTVNFKNNNTPTSVIRPYD